MDVWFRMPGLHQSPHLCPCHSLDHLCVPELEYIHSEVILSSREGSHLHNIVLVIVDVRLLIVILSALIVYWVLQLWLS